MILKIMAKNARTPYTEIARQVNLSDVAIMKRVKKLESKIIKQYTIVVDPRELGYKVVSITGIDVEPDKLLSALEAIKSKEYVKGVWLTSGDHAIMAVIWSYDENELLQIHKDILSIEGVKRVCPAIVLRTIKDIDMMFKID